MNTTIPPQANINATAIKTTDNMVRVEKLAPSILTILLSDEKITGEVIAKSQLGKPELNKPQLEKLELANLKLGLNKTHISILTIKTTNGEIDIKTKLSIPIGRNIILTMPTKNNITPPKPPYSLNIQIINNAPSNAPQVNAPQVNAPQVNMPQLKSQTTDSIKSVITKNITEGMKFTAIIKDNHIISPNSNQIARPQRASPATIAEIPTTDTAAKTQPTTDTAAKTQPTTDTAAKTQPTTDTAAKTQPTTDTAAKTQPTTAMAASTDNIKLPNGWSVDLKNNCYSKTRRA